MNPEDQVNAYLKHTLTVNANIKIEFFIFNKLSVLMTGTERSYPKNVIVAKLCSHNPRKRTQNSVLFWKKGSQLLH